MEQSVLTSIVLPISLAIIMMGMGLSLKISDFSKATKYPKATLLGLLNQLILLPIIGYFVAIIFNLSPYFAVGLMILVACPGGTTSNIITFVSKGDVALSVILTAITSFVTLFTIPLILNFALATFSSESVELATLPFWNTLNQILLIAVLPICLGMMVNAWKPKFAKKMNSPMRIISVVIFLVILLGIIIANKDILVSSLKKVGLATFTLNVVTLLLGYFISKFGKLSMRQTLTVMIESGIQNSGLGLVIATTILMNSEMTVPIAVYSLIMFFTGGIIMIWFGRMKEKAEI